MTTRPRPTAGPRSRASARPTLPAERAFVVQLRADADLARGVVRGRLEHLVSGTAALFESVEQLLAGMQDALRCRPTAALAPPAEAPSHAAAAAPRRGRPHAKALGDPT